MTDINTLAIIEATSCLVKMKFCPTCDNMLYITTENKSLIYHCKCCNHREVSNEKSMRIMKKEYKDDATSYKQFISPFIKHDPTLPRINNIPCVYDDCVNRGKETETIYIKYDNDNMKYIYFCCNCDRYWKT